MRTLKLLLPLVVLILASVAAGQENVKKYHNYDFTKKVVTKAELAKLNYTLDELEGVNELALLRGVVFGKRGRVFKEKSIQSYLEKQTWYKAKPGFSNAVLTPTERKNLDMIRLAEAERHRYIEPGDLRLWMNKEIPDEKILPFTAAEWTILIAEFEAVHGKTFSEEWLQKYFDDRYWYKRNPNYNPGMLNATEKKNLAKFIEKKNEARQAEVSRGDMDKFQNVLLKESQLKGLYFSDLRLIRNEFFARRGKKFTVAAYRQAFEWEDWYKPLKDQSKVKLNATEEANVKLIEAYENRLREKLQTEVLSEEFFSGMYAEDLRILRNEIFAKKGRVFKDKALQKYFEAQPWYKADPTFTDDRIGQVMTEIEIKNIASIRKEEELAISKFQMVEG